jgi:hypothetical protein
MPAKPAATDAATPAENRSVVENPRNSALSEFATRENAFKVFGLSGLSSGFSFEA